jgi:hypothetical protein
MWLIKITPLSFPPVPSILWPVKRLAGDGLKMAGASNPIVTYARSLVGVVSRLKLLFSLFISLYLSLFLLLASFFLLLFLPLSSCPCLPLFLSSSFPLLFFSPCPLLPALCACGCLFFGPPVENKGLEPLTPCVQGRCSKPTELIPLNETEKIKILFSFFFFLCCGSPRQS